MRNINSTPRMVNQMDNLKKEMRRCQRLLRNGHLDTIPSLQNTFAKRIDYLIGRYQYKFKLMFGYEDERLEDYLHLIDNE